MKTNLKELYKSNPLKACREALRRTQKFPEKIRLEQINDLLGGYGTEAIRGNWQNGYWWDIVGCYVNFGDTYNLTIMQVRGDYSFTRSRFFISSWGDWVERNQRKYGLK